MTNEPGIGKNNTDTPSLEATIEENRYFWWEGTAEGAKLEFSWKHPCRIFYKPYMKVESGETTRKTSKLAHTVLKKTILLGGGWKGREA